MLRIIQGVNSVFKMKSGLKPILVKSPRSNALLDFIFKESKISTGGSGNVNSDVILLLEFPLDDLELCMSDVKATENAPEPLATTISTFFNVVTLWKSRLSVDINSIFDGKDDAEFVAKSISYHYYQAGPALTTIQKIIDGVLGQTSVDCLKTARDDITVAYDELSKHISVSKPTKEFVYIAAHFTSSVCLYSPCLHDVNMTMYPFKYDLGLGNLCRDVTKGTFDIWQTEGVVQKSVKVGEFFHFDKDAKLHLCLTVDGVKNAKLQAGIELFGSIHKGTFVLKNNKILITQNRVKLFGKYDFTINSTVNLELKAWDKASIKTYAVATDTSLIKTDLQNTLDNYVVSQYNRLDKRIKDSNEQVTSLSRLKAGYIASRNQNRGLVAVLSKELKETEANYTIAQKNAKGWRDRYQLKRTELLNIEQDMEKNCTVTRCSRSCHKLRKCKVCQDPYHLKVEVPSCKSVLEDRSYGFEKSEKSVCSHVVTDWKSKYTGNCKKPPPDSTYEKSIIERINGKINKKEPLTLEDAIDLESINEEKGKQLRKQIEQQRFFQFFSMRLQNQLLTDADFESLAKYTNKTFADGMRRKMQEIKKSGTLHRIAQKMKNGQKLTEDDYQKLRDINPQLEKQIKKNEVISDIMQKIRLLGSVTKEDLNKLKKLAPEYAKNLTRVLENQDVAKKMLDDIMKKMGNGTLSPDDIAALEKVNPGVAEKLKAALKEQLSQKVKQMQNNLNSVKGSIGVGLNNTGHTDMIDQLNMLSGSLKTYDRKALKELEEKIKANNATSGNVFQEVMERLDLAFDIKHLTGNSKDIKRVYDQFFAVLPKFNVPSILQRSEGGFMKGLNNVQEWFTTAAKIAQQACQRCQTNCTANATIMLVAEELTTSLVEFNKKVCLSKWSVGVRTQGVNTVCSTITSMLNAMVGADCSHLQKKMIEPLNKLVEGWKKVKTDVEEMKKDQWKQSQTSLKLFKEYRTFTNALKTAFSKELGSVNLTSISEADIVSKVQKTLAGKKSSTNLAEMNALLVIMQEIIVTLEKLPNLVKQNKQNTIQVSDRDGRTIIENFDKIFGNSVPFLQDICRDKKPVNVATLTKLIGGARIQLKTITAVKDLDGLLLFTQRRVGKFAKYIVVTLNKELDALEGCELKQDVVTSSNNSNTAVWIEDAFTELNDFLTKVKPLEQKTIKSLADDLRTLIGEYSSGGLESPVGKLMDLAEDFVEESPSFNLPVIVSFSPKVSAIALNTFKEYMGSALDILNGMKAITEQCKGGKCNPQEVFGKRRLAQVFDKLEKYIQTISNLVAKYTQKTKKYPKGLEMLASALEQVQVSLNTFSESGTGLSEGLDDVISAFNDVMKSTDMIKKNLKSYFEVLASLKNNDLKKIFDNVKMLRKATVEIYNINQSDNLRQNLETIESLLGQLGKESSEVDDRVSAFERRLSLIQKIGQLIKAFGSSFEELYSPASSNDISNKVDLTFAPAVASALGNTKDLLDKLLKETKSMGDEIGLDLPAITDDTTNLPRIVNDMVASMGVRKTQLAKQLTVVSNKVSIFFEDVSETMKAKYEEFMGKIGKYKKQYEELKKKLKKYGDIYDEVEGTIKEIKDKPLSKIGEIKDATEDLINELMSYDLSLIVSADPEIMKKKMDEMKQLFGSLADAFGEIDQILRKCKRCKVEKIFGYRFLKNSAKNVEKAFNYMLVKVEKIAEKVGGGIGEMQQMKKVAGQMRNKFFAITESGEFSLDTLKKLSDSLKSSTLDITALQKHAENLGEILLNRDVDLQIIGGNINKVVNMLANVMNKSFEVGKQSKKVYDKAVEIKTKFNKLKETSRHIQNGPLATRLDVAKSLAEDCKQMLTDFPELFKLSKDTLNKAGINTKWLTEFGGTIDKLTKSLTSSLDKTEQVLEAADIAVQGVEEIKQKLPLVASSWQSVLDSSWDNKIPSLQNALKDIGSVLDMAVDTSIRSAGALDVSLTRNDLKSKLQTLVGKERVEKFQNLYKNVSRMLNQLQQGPITEIGKLTDSVDDFIDTLDGYDFGKMLLNNPNDIRNKITEFQQLTKMTGDIMKDLGRISGQCKGCDILSVFGKGFTNAFTQKLTNKFGGIKESIEKVADRVDTGLAGWQDVLATTTKISDNFKSIDLKNGFTRQSFDDISQALGKSAREILDLKNGTADIFKAIFDGDKDMESLRFGFEGLVHKVSGVLNTTSIALPKAGKVYDSANKVKDIFDNIGGDFDNLKQGPVETRIEVLKNIGQGIDAIGKSLPLIFDQSTDVLQTLGLNSSWFRKFSGSLWSVSQSLSNVVNKTDTLLTGAGLVVKDVRNMQGLASGIQNDYQKILKAPWGQKFDLLTEALGKADKIVKGVSHSASIFDNTIKQVASVDLGVEESLKDLTNDVSGVIGNITDAVKKLATVSKDISTTIDQIKSGPIEKIGKLTDSTKEFVDNLKNYDIADILLLSPKFAKERFGDLKEIVSESGDILRNISQLVGKHCKSCDFNKIFGRNFSSDVLGGIGKSMKKIAEKVDGILDKVDAGATSAAGIITSVRGIKEDIEKLNNVGFDQEGFTKIADVLHSTSEHIQNIGNDSVNIFNLIFNGNGDLFNVSKRFEGFVNEFASFIESAGNFSSNIADAFDQVIKIKKTFKETLGNIDDLTEGPIENRVKAVKNIADGINSMIKAVPDLLQKSPLSSKWLRGFGSKLQGVTSGISELLNKTSEIAQGVGETIESVQKVGETAQIIGNEFNRLLSAGSVGGKVKVALNIVNKVKTLTSQVNDVAANVGDTFEKLSGKTLDKTNIFGAKTEELLGDITKGLTTVADRYSKFTNLSKALSESFDRLEDDPIKFALEDLPVIFNQTANFVSLIYKDVSGIANKIGINMDKFNLDTKLVQSAKSFFKFANTTLAAINSGKQLIDDFKSLVNSDSFKDALHNFNNVMDSGNNFLENMDTLGKTLFKNWGNMKGELSKTLNDVAKSVGVNLKSIGSALSKGLAIGKNVLSIASNLEQLFNMKEFNATTVAQAAESVISIMKSGVEIAKQFGFDASIPGLDTAEMLGTVTAVINIYRGIKDFTNWLKGACDLTYKASPVHRNVTYLCLLPKLQIQKEKVLVEDCVVVNKTVTRGFGEGKICCPTRECVYMQDVKCLYDNEQCMSNRALFVKQSNKIDQSTRDVYLNYHKFDAEARSIESDVRIARIKLERAQLTLNRTVAGFTRTANTLDKLTKARALLGIHWRNIGSIKFRKQSHITIDKVEFEVSQYKPQMEILPVRITLSDKFSKLSYLDITIDTRKPLQQSFDSIIRVIVREAVEYIAIPGKRRRRSLTNSNPGISEEKRNATYWSHICERFTESLNLLETIAYKLSDEVDTMTDKPSSYTKPQTFSSSSQLAAKQEKLLRELVSRNSEATESPQEAVQRWQRSSEGILMEELGAVCFSFNDCIHAQVERLKDQYEPAMEGHGEVRKALENFHNLIQTLLAKQGAFTREFIAKMKDGLLTAITTVKQNTYFCDEHPRLAERMPISQYAYLGEYFELKCTVNGPAGMIYSWTRNGTTLPTQTDWKLKLATISVSDQGVYKCHGRTVTGKTSSNQILVRVIQPITFKSQPDDIVMQYPGGIEAVNLVCNATTSIPLKFKWWYRPYDSKHKQLISATSILVIKTVRSSNIGHYWCEVTDGQTIVTSKKSKLDIVRIVERRESVRLHMSLVTDQKQWRCQMPSSPTNTNTLTAMFEARIKGLFGDSTDATMITASYRADSRGDKKAKLNIDFKTRRNAGDHQTTRRHDSKIGFALKVSNERAELQTKLNHLLEEIKRREGLDVQWKNCSYKSNTLDFAVDWQVEELACPRGMQASSDVVNCGKFIFYISAE